MPDLSTLPSFSYGIAKQLTVTTLFSWFDDYNLYLGYMVTTTLHTHVLYSLYFMIRQMVAIQ